MVGVFLYGYRKDGGEEGSAQTVGGSDQLFLPLSDPSFLSILNPYNEDAPPQLLQTN